MILAAVTSDQPGAVDTALAALCDRIAAQGGRVVGAVQLVPRPGCVVVMDLRLLPQGQVLRISQALGPGSEGCRLNAGALEDAVALAEAAFAAATPALLVVNRFGKQEASGRGFAPLIARAAEAGVPVIVGLSPQFDAMFADYACGLAQMLPTEADMLWRWWAGLPA